MLKDSVDLFFNYKEDFYNQIKRLAQVDDNVLMIDLRDEEVIYPGNRFVKYALFPETNISIQVLWGFKKQNTVFTVGKSIINKSSQVNIGDIMLEYGGGGHRNAGTCQVTHEAAPQVLKEIIVRLKD